MIGSEGGELDSEFMEEWTGDEMFMSKERVFLIGEDFLSKSTDRNTLFSSLKFPGRMHNSQHLIISFNRQVSSNRRNVFPYSLVLHTHGQSRGTDDISVILHFPVHPRIDLCRESIEALAAMHK